MTYEPLNTLKQIGENIWIVDGEVIKMKFAFIHVPFSTRMTIVRLEDGHLWCHSPIKLNDTLIKALEPLGTVRYLISPNKLHYAYLPEWQEVYREALTYASPGVDKRARAKGQSIPFTHDLTDIAPQEWVREIDQLIFKGSPVIEEVVFFHRASKTLILTDLIENFEKQKVNHPFWTFIHKIARIAAPKGETPIDYRLSFTNKKQARSCLEAMIAWQPEKIILAHGKWFRKNGIQELKRAFRWLIK